MSKGDYIYLNRSLMVNDLWKDEPFTRGQAWVDLLMLANWKSGVAVLKGEKVPYERGQLCRAMKQLSLRWKWSEGKVKRYLDLLQDLEQITFKNYPENGAQKRYITTLITITNYNIYQSDGAPTEREQSVDGAPTERGRSGGKKVKKEKENTIDDFLRMKIAKAFDTVYADYPRKEGRKEALVHYIATVKTIQDVAKISEALDEYIEQVKGTKRQYIKQASTWFNNWRDYVPNNWEPLYEEIKQEWESEYENNKREEDGPGADD